MTDNDLRARVCAQARSWLGRKEADGSHRAIIDVYNSITPLPRGYRMTYADPWCAAFVSAVGQALGLTAWIYPECGCGPMIALYQAAGRWMEDDAYRPRPGDVILYDWEDTGVGDNRGNPDHVGLVYAVDGDTITAIEGNCGDAVDTRQLRRDGRYIRGYGLPDYASAASAINAHEDPDDAPQDEPPAVVIVPDQAPVSSQDTCKPELPVLRDDDDGAAVENAQALLIRHGYYCGGLILPDGREQPDGEFGPQTALEVRAFQALHGLTVDGIIGPETWRALICT